MKHRTDDNPNILKPVTTPDKQRKTPNTGYPYVSPDDTHSFVDFSVREL